MNMTNIMNITNMTNLPYDIIENIFHMLCSEENVLPFNLVSVSKYFNTMMKQFVNNLFADPETIHYLIASKMPIEYQYIMRIDNAEEYIMKLLNTLHKIYYIKKGHLLPTYIIKSEEFKHLSQHSYYIADKIIDIYGINICYLDRKFKNDPVLALKAIQNDIYAHIHVGDIKYSNQNIIKYLALNRPDVVIHNSAFNQNLLFIKTTLENNGQYLKHFNNSIKDNKKFVNYAVKNDYQAFRFASVRLKNDTYYKDYLTTLNPDINRLRYYW